MTELRVYLLREDVNDPADALRTGATSSAIVDSLEEREPNQDVLPEGARFFWGTHKAPSPKWMAFVAELVADPIEAPGGLVRSGILFLPHASRWFIFTFGHGFHGIDDDAVEPQFGIKVALNTLNPDQVRAIDTKTMSHRPLHTLRQLARAGPLEDFHISSLEELVNLVEAIPEDSNFADLVRGRDSLTLKKDVAPADLTKLCGQLLAAFQSKRYKEIWPLLDRLTTVQDKTVARILDAELAAAVSANAATVYVGTPEAFLLEGIDGFRYASHRTHTGLRLLEPPISEYLLLHPAGVDPENLRKDKLQAFKTDGMQAKEWSVYKCLQWETRLDDISYVINDGKWFRVQDKFQNELDERIVAATCNTKLPDVGSHEVEPDYNKRAAKELDCACADRELFKIPGHPHSIEVCDLFTKKRQLIHVKVFRGAANASYVLTQGVVSAEGIRDKAVASEFRKRLKDKCKRPTEAMAVDVPVRTADYHVVFGLILPRGFNFPRALPIFSKIAIDKNLEMLTGMGYKACVVPIWRA